MTHDQTQNSGSHLIIEMSRDEGRIKTCVYERGYRDESPVRPYDFIDVDFTKVDGIVQDLLAQLQRGQSRPRLTPELINGFKKSGQVLLDLVIPYKLKRLLHPTRCTTVSLSLEESLMHIPWEFLHNGTQYLCEQFAIGRILRTRQLTAPPQHLPVESPFRALILADPCGNLPSAYREGVEIRGFMDEFPELFLADFKSQPIEVAFVKENIRDYDVIHYAGHAEYATASDKDGWLLTDGRIGPSDILSMSGLIPMPSLVFSNACQTGRFGPAVYTGQLTLVNSFLLSGTQHYIGTFWDVGDEPSLRLAESFYRNLAIGKAVGEALRTARRELVDELGDQSLLSATHILYGDPMSVYNKGDLGLEKAPARVPYQVKSLSPPATSIPARRRFSVGAVLGFLILFLGALGYSLSHRKDAPGYAAYLSNLVSKEFRGGLFFEQVPSSLNMQIVSQKRDESGRYTRFLVTEGAVLRSGDKFQVQAVTNQSAYIYVLLYDSQGRASRLFPHPKINQSGFVHAGAEVVVPDRDLWFWLDENSGTETIFVMATATEFTQMAALLDRMEQAGRNPGAQSQKKTLAKAFVERGVGGVSNDVPLEPAEYLLGDNDRIARVTDVVHAAGAHVKALSFRHR